MGKNLTYLLHLYQVAYHESLPPIWKVLVGAPKRQKLMCLQQAFDDTARRIGVRAPIVATPGLLNMTLFISFCLNHRDYLGDGDPPFLPGEAHFLLWEVSEGPCCPTTGSSPRCSLRSHSLVCTEHHLIIVGIGPILSKEIEFIYQSNRSDRTYVYS